MALPLWIAAGMMAAVFLTATLSGVFGMAGGMILLWLLLLLLPVEAAIAVHGIIQVVANGSRAWFSRNYVDWRILCFIVAGLLTAALLLLAVRYQPDARGVYFAVGLMPVLVWMPKAWLALDAAKPHHAFVCGLVAGGLNLTIGLSGPTTDIFFIRMQMDRRTVIATKAATQVISHAAKIAFYANAAMMLTGGAWTAIALAAPLAILGTRAGAAILHRMTDANFRAWTRWIVTAIGVAYLVQGVMLVA
jgi:uncharacterized membrane protein YfcA